MIGFDVRYMLLNNKRYNFIVQSFKVGVKTAHQQLLISLNYLNAV